MFKNVQRYGSPTWFAMETFNQALADVIASSLSITGEKCTFHENNEGELCCVVKYNRDDRNGKALIPAAVDNAHPVFWEVILSPEITEIEDWEFREKRISVFHAPGVTRIGPYAFAGAVIDEFHCPEDLNAEGIDGSAFDGTQIKRLVLPDDFLEEDKGGISEKYYDIASVAGEALMCVEEVVLGYNGPVSKRGRSVAGEGQRGVDVDRLKNSDAGPEFVQSGLSTKRVIWRDGTVALPKHYIFPGVEEVLCPRTLAFISYDALEKASYLKKISGIENVSAILAYAFDDTPNLAEFAWPKRATVIASGTFRKSGIETITGTENVLTIEGGAFEQTENLEEISIPKVTTIGGGAFNPSGVNRVNIKNLIDIEDSAFWGAHLTNFKFPQTVSLGKNPFRDSWLPAFSGVLFDRPGHCMTAEQVILNLDGARLGFFELPKNITTISKPQRLANINASRIDISSLRSVSENTAFDFNSSLREITLPALENFDIVEGEALSPLKINLVDTCFPLYNSDSAERLANVTNSVLSAFHKRQKYGDCADSFTISFSDVVCSGSEYFSDYIRHLLTDDVSDESLQYLNKMRGNGNFPCLDLSNLRDCVPGIWPENDEDTEWYVKLPGTFTFADDFPNALSDAMRLKGLFLPRISYTPVDLSRKLDRDFLEILGIRDDIECESYSSFFELAPKVFEYTFTAPLSAKAAIAKFISLYEWCTKQMGLSFRSVKELRFSFRDDEDETLYKDIRRASDYYENVVRGIIAALPEIIVSSNIAVTFDLSKTPVENLQFTAADFPWDKHDDKLPGCGLEWKIIYKYGFETICQRSRHGGTGDVVFDVEGNHALTQLFLSGTRYDWVTARGASDEWDAGGTSDEEIGTSSEVDGASEERDGGRTSDEESGTSDEGDAGGTSDKGPVSIAKIEEPSFGAAIVESICFNEHEALREVNIPSDFPLVHNRLSDGVMLPIRFSESSVERINISSALPITSLGSCDYMKNLKTFSLPPSVETISNVAF
ncbi:MAG: leucine-rich repeat domain-containing protein, partial [Holosporales bacterium]|nr:leucine-rich repeat domain-containing protein [Holosporales bacterium]